jgi:chromosome segregation ATPase
MANPRDLAEQAFALLQNALSESEARATDLDEQLKRKRQPKTRVEEQLDVLTHRLETVEAERSRWEKQAGHLEEIAEQERIKVAQLKKKLEIAESGPEKLTKKEINFWRGKADGIDIEIREYKDRLAALRRELNERDALIEKLQTGGSVPAAPAAPSTGGNDAVAELRRQLEQRDSWLADLRLELHELRAEPQRPPLETEAAVETLRSQVAALERALADVHNQHAAANADRQRNQSESAERERALREATATAERAQTALGEREHRIVELSAQAEHLRNELRQRDERVATLAHDAETLRARLEQSQESAAFERAAAEEREQDYAKQRELLAANETDFRELSNRLAERDAALEEHRQQLTERDQAAGRELDELRRALSDHERERAAHEQQLRDLGVRLADRDVDLAASAAEIERLREAEQSTSREIERARTTLTANERELASMRDTLLSSSRELDGLRANRQRLETALADSSARAEASAEAMASAREQIAGLESELKEEREHAESLGELANERREHMTKLQEQVEDAEERFAEANWKLGKALHFERIVQRRKGLVRKLLDALRAKAKANTALKAGIDGLRTFKASAEINQQKLLKRIDGLKAELIDAEETVKRHQGGTAAREELVSAVSRATALEERLNTQAELIQSLEADLKTARLAQKPGDDKAAEVERLTKELETKNQVIERLEADIDEQQRKLGKLRGSESETMRLKALTEKDRGEIDALQREVTQLRDALARQAGVGDAPASGNSAELEARLKEREQSVTRLMGTVKEHEATIKKLNEAAESWKRKYQFLATDPPEAYKSGAEK